MTTLTATVGEAIPVDLQHRRQWVCWRLEHAEGGRGTKVPCNARTGQRASVDDPRTWTTFKQAQAASSFDGIGFVLTEQDPYCGLDLDGCRDPETGAIAPWAEEIIAALDSYTEVSPSGTGIHIIARGDLPPGWRKQTRVEMYDRGRYLTVTGNHLPGTPTTVEERTAAIAALHARLSSRSDSAPDAIPERWAKMLANGYEQALAHWEGRAGGHPDQSGSGKDMKLAHFARKLGFNPDETADILAGAPYDVHGGRPADYIQRTVEKAFAGKGTRRAQAGEGYGALWARVVHSGLWASLSPKGTAVYGVLVVLAMRPSGIVRAGLATLAELSGVSVRKVQAATAELAKIGLIRKKQTPRGSCYWVLGPEELPPALTCMSERDTQVSAENPLQAPTIPAAAAIPPRHVRKGHTGQTVRGVRKGHTGASGHEVVGGALRCPVPSGGGEGMTGHRGPTGQPSKRHMWSILPTGERVVYEKQVDSSLVEVGRTLPDPEEEQPQ